jgi:hypothetical protein
MIAVIEAKHKAVWGFGQTPEEAMANAKHWIEFASPAIRPAAADLSYAHLAPDADLDCDGQVLWQWVIQSKSADTGTVQHTLF